MNIHFIFITHSAGDETDMNIWLLVQRSNKSILKKSVLNIHWKDWCWSWSSNTLATWCKELTHWKRPWCWERSKAGREGGERGQHSWIAPLTQWTWISASSERWWRSGKPGMLQSMGLQSVRHSEWLSNNHEGCSAGKWQNRESSGGCLASGLATPTPGPCSKHQTHQSDQPSFPISPFQDANSCFSPRALLGGSHSGPLR